MAKPPVADNAPDDGELRFRRMPGNHVRRLHQVAGALFAGALESCDITPVQYAALAALERRGPMSQAALSGLIACDRATLGGVVDRLEAKGWLERSSDPADRRLRVLVLTTAGRKLLRKAHPRVRRVQEALLKPLDPAERGEFARLCLKLLAHHEA